MVPTIEETVVVVKDIWQRYRDTVDRYVGAYFVCHLVPQGALMPFKLFMGVEDVMGARARWRWIPIVVMGCLSVCVSLRASCGHRLKDRTIIKLQQVQELAIQWIKS